ncbi:MFS transporter [Actinomyces provencensis]|uniref:MFS transporter n=1 Tax=Actinomyces provencensis TaxID=1720198 RepID=UPI0018A8547D|nr:MFS transporter [Actinomyces provencensis]
MGIVTNPVIGHLSDTTRSRLGRRRPWLLAGVPVVLALSVAAGSADSVPALTLWWSLLQVGVNMMMAPLAATVPDLVPEGRRGRATACLGIAGACAPVLGTAVQAVLTSPALTYPALAALIAVSQAVFVSTLRGDDVQPRPRPRVLPRATGRGSRALLPHDRDFWIVWVHRLLFALGQNAALAYLFYYLQDVIDYEGLNPGRTTDDGVLLLTAVYAPCVMAAAVVVGALSDRTRRFRVYIIGATLLFGTGAVLGAVTGSWGGVLALAALTGIGYGAYEEVSMAMAIHLLPDDERRGRDLSIINVATLLAIGLGPFVAAAGIALSGYAAVFLGSGVLVLVGGMMVTLVRGAR